MTKYFDLTEQEIIKGCLNKDRKAQEQLYRKYANEMFSVCLAYEADRDAAKDILQESFIKVFRNLDKYNNDGPLKGWIRRIVVNTAIDYFRRKGDQGRFVDVDQVAEVIPSQEGETQNLNVKDILSHVKKLPEKARLVFNLFALEGYSHKEIAIKLDITEGTSKSQFSRARQLLQQSLKAS